MEESLISNRERLRHTDLGRRIVWKLLSAETITCVVPNAFRTLELLVLSNEIEFDAFSEPSWNQASAESTCFVERKSSVPEGKTPPPPSA